MGVNWWGTGGTCPPPHFCQWGDRISYAPPPPPPTHTHTPFGIEKNHIFPYLFAFYGHFYWTYPDHVLTLYLYSDILSMYSIQMMRGNRNKSHNDVHFSKQIRPPLPPNFAVSRNTYFYITNVSPPPLVFLENYAHGRNKYGYKRQRN